MTHWYVTKLLTPVFTWTVFPHRQLIDLLTFPLTHVSDFLKSSTYPYMTFFQILIFILLPGVTQ